MTIADRIRGMTDEELATFLTAILSERDRIISKQFAEKGVPNTLVEVPIVSYARHLEYLRSPWEGGASND